MSGEAAEEKRSSQKTKSSGFTRVFLKETSSLKFRWEATHKYTHKGKRESFQKLQSDCLHRNTFPLGFHFWFGLLELPVLPHLCLFRFGYVMQSINEISECSGQEILPLIMIIIFLLLWAHTTRKSTFLLKMFVANWEICSPNSLSSHRGVPLTKMKMKIT